MEKKVIIVGGVAAGASCAARLRRLDEKAEIIMFEKGEHISYANCGLPYYIGDSIKDRNNLLVQTPEAMHKRFNIDVRVNSEVIFLDTEGKKVKVKSKDKGEYEETYDYILLAPGASPLTPPIPGIDSTKIFTLRNVKDTDKIKNYINLNKINKALVIGGGYVGIEMAENLRELGMDVTVVEAAPHILAPFDSDMVTIAEKELNDNGVNLILGDGVKAFKEEGQNLITSLSSGKSVEAQMVILAIGVQPDTKFLKDSGVELSERGHIVVNEYMETNKEGVYAAGDAVLVKDFIDGSIVAIPLAGPANKQGRIVADNMEEIKTSYDGTIGTSVIKIFNQTGAATGNNERTLIRKGIPYKAIYLHPQSHASYYVGATPISIKLLFNMEGKILGAQAFGYDGVEKRIDHISNVIKLKGNVTDLTELELSYAPPYSSAKDPVNMAGFIAENVITGKMDIIVPKDIDERDKDATFLLDVRTTLEFNNGKIEGATNIPVDELRDRLGELPKDKILYVYCQVGLRGYIAARILTANGFKCKNLTGGYKTYISSKYIPKNHINESETYEDIKVMKKESTVTKEIDACGLCCPGPIMQAKVSIDGMNEGECLRIKASDPGFYEDIKAWCKGTGNELMNLEKEGAFITALIQKGGSKEALKETAITKGADSQTMVVFSGDFDKAIASFIIANGALAMGKKVTMFFTFWGLNVLRKPEKVSVTKGFIEKMFGIMMPRGSKKLKLSNMNMMGMGAKMIRGVMKDKNITSLEDLIKSAIDGGANIVACQMSMDVMGIKKEELIDGITIGGVGYYLGEATDSNINLFI